MGKRLIVDFRIAADEFDSLNSPDWAWPVPQSNYDDPLRKFTEWCNQLPTELAHNAQLKTAFELVEIEMMKELVSIAATWIDVAATKRYKLDLVFHPQQNLYRMFDEDRFTSYSLDQDIYSARFGTLRSQVGRRLRRLKQWSGMSRIRNSNLSISPNKLTTELLPLTVADIRLDIDDLNRVRARYKVDMGNGVDDLVNQITSQLDLQLTSIDSKFSANGRKFVAQIVESHIKHGISDQNLKLPISKIDQSTRLYTGTGGIYRSRLFSHLVQGDGGSVIRATHGGETVLFNDPLWPKIELPFANKYMTFGSRSAAIVEDQLNEHPRFKSDSSKPEIRAVGSQYHSNLISRSTTVEAIKDGDRIAVISAAFTGERRALPHIKIHDVVYLQWHARLLDSIRSLGYTALSKRHPKGLAAGKSLFAANSDVELIRVGMDSLANVAGYVFDITASAFMEAMCTLKPIVLIDIPNRRLTQEGRRRIQESVQIVEAYFDSQNRVQIDQASLADALREPVDLDARHKFLNDYLLSPPQ
jgi:hypothetical protein